MIWASEPRTSLVTTCAGCPSPILFVFFFFPDLSITNSASCRSRVTGGPCKRSSEIDRQVRKLIVVQDTSAEAKHYSSYTLPASPLLPYTIQPPCEEPSLIHWPPNALFSLASLMPLKSWDVHRISLAAWEKFPQYWFDLENPAGSPLAPPVLRVEDFPANPCY